MKSSTLDTVKPVLPESGQALFLTPTQRSELRARAHALNPVVMLGHAGLTDAVLLEIESALKAHELIKLKISGGDRASRAGIQDTICQRLSAAPVQQIGKVLVLYRPR